MTGIVDWMEELYETFSKLINVSFGIGTNLTNDVGDYKPLSMVIKMVECNQLPVAKISDSSGKSMYGDGDTHVQHLKDLFGRK